MAAIVNESGAAALLDEGGNDLLDEAGNGLWLFSGPQSLYYPSYIDVQAGHTLTVTPGDTYEIAPGGQGDPVMDADNPVPPPDGLWEAAD